MTIKGFDKDQFVGTLSAVVSASRPIRSIQYLKGRQADLAAIEKALYAAGRHVFIFGDRGVGKSSLAATAAYIYQSSDAEPIFVSGSQDDTFRIIISNIVYQALKRPRTKIVKSTKNAGFEWKGLKFGLNSEVSWPDIASQIHSIGDAMELLLEVEDIFAEKPVVLLDEFDTISDAQERGKFASLLKQLGDRDSKLKFIFTGIGKSLDELLGAHQSAHRQLLTHLLPKMDWDARREIVNAAASEFNLTVDNDVNWRIAAISDGYPYYVHLILEFMLWAAFNDEMEVYELTWSHFHEGLREAVQSINAELRRPYEQAVLHRSREYEDVVWSTADHEDLFRSLSSMYDSYKVITRKRKVDTEVDRNRYATLVRKLKESGYGAILQSEVSRPGWYSYKEKMLRGYVRMQAEANGFELIGEREAPKQFMRVSNARHGYRCPAIPSGVRQDKNLKELERFKEAIDKIDFDK